MERKNTRYQIKLVESKFGPTVIVFEEGLNPDYSDELGFFGLMDNGMTATSQESLFASIQNVLPHKFRDLPVLIEPTLLSILLEAFAKSRENLGESKND